MALSNKEATNRFLATLQQQWATAEEASKLNAKSNVRQESATAYLRLQNEANVVAVNAHGNRTNGQLLAQNAHKERQDQQAFKQQEAFTANLATAVNAIHHWSDSSKDVSTHAEPGDNSGGVPAGGHSDDERTVPVPAGTAELPTGGVERDPYTRTGRTSHAKHGKPPNPRTHTLPIEPEDTRHEN
jgi:hypothetical protein